MMHSLDLDGLERQLGGGRDRAMRVLDAFLEDFDGWSLEADRAFRASDHPGLCGLVHAIKGAASSVSAMRVAQAAEALDRELRADPQLLDQPRVGRLLAALSSELAIVIAELKSNAWSAGSTDGAPH